MALNVRPRRAVLAYLSIIIACGLAIAAAYGDSNEAPELPASLRPFMSKELVALFDTGSIVVSDGAGFSQLAYRLFKPILSSNDRELRYPLIIFLNGHGDEQTQDDDLGQLKHLQDIIFHEPKHPELYPFFLLALHCPLDNSGKCMQWFNTESTNEAIRKIDPIEASMRIVDELLRKYPVDPDRILVLGISSGGTAAWELATRHSDRFAAVVPTGSRGEDNAHLSRIGKLPIWAFHSTGDNPEPVKKTIEQLNQLGGNAHLTLITRDTHGCWDQAFERYDVLDWMLSQRRRDENADWSKSAAWHAARRDYFSSLGVIECLNETWPRVIPIAIVVAIVFLIRREVSKARRKRSGQLKPPAPLDPTHTPVKIPSRVEASP